MTNFGAKPHARTRDPRVHSLRRSRELDYNNAQLTARKRASEHKRHAGYVASEDWFHLSASALQRGGHMVRPGVVAWPAAGKCENPVLRTIKGLVTDLYGNVEARENGTRTRFLDMEVRCRRCRNCLYMKALHWRHRSMAEIEISYRTWLVTLTFNPAIRARMNMQARTAVGGEAWDALSLEQRDARLANQANSYVTLWLKRVREQSGAGLRYVSVVERHKDGFPHCHLLVHETEPESPLRHAHLSRQWRYGFSNVKLVEDGEVAAKYVAKYLAKDPVSRVRASVGYGHNRG